MFFLLAALLSTTNPIATDAGLKIMENGGNAIDAAIAAQMVLNVVEPHATGIGGGGFLLYYDKKEKKVIVYDGRETAPLAFEKKEKQEAYFASLGGQSVGVPGLLALCKLAHEKKGKLPWKNLFQPAITLAKEGFCKNLKNEPLAETFEKISVEGIKPFYEGIIADEIIQKTKSTKVNPGKITKKDMKNYKALERQPLIFDYKEFRLYGLPSPASGLTPFQILGFLEDRNLNSYDLGSLEFINLFCQSSQLSFFDRKTFISDPDFFDIPEESLLNKSYLKKRGELIQRNGSLSPFPFALDREQIQESCSITVMDDEGNSVALVTTLGNAFGAKLNVCGFYLNNNLGNFSNESGPNQGQGGKRPMSSLCPLMVFDKKKESWLLTLSSGAGPYAIDYTAQALFGVLEFGMDLQSSIDYPHYVAISEEIILEKETFLKPLMKTLKAFGHPVSQKKLESKTCGIMDSNTASDHRL